MSFLKKILGIDDSPQQQPQVQQAQYQGGVRLAQQRPQEQLQVQQAQGNPQNLQQTWGGTLGSGTRIPNFTQPSRQRTYEDEYLPDEAIQPAGFTNPQVTTNQRIVNDPYTSLRRLLGIR